MCLALSNEGLTFQQLKASGGGSGDRFNLCFARRRFQGTLVTNVLEDLQNEFIFTAHAYTYIWDTTNKSSLYRDKGMFDHSNIHIIHFNTASQLAGTYNEIIMQS